ncbi:MAG: hypothetical protein JWQ49_3903 [Edaphobacter sp.]|nr:hypothetical protein [Edaphobacter sp.]
MVSWWGQSKAYTSALDPSMPTQLSPSLDLQDPTVFERAEVSE